MAMKIKLMMAGPQVSSSQPERIIEMLPRANAASHSSNRGPWPPTRDVSCHADKGQAGFRKWLDQKIRVTGGE